MFIGKVCARSPIDALDLCWDHNMRSRHFELKKRQIVWEKSVSRAHKVSWIERMIGPCCHAELNDSSRHRYNPTLSFLSISRHDSDSAGIALFAAALGDI